MLDGSTRVTPKLSATLLDHVRHLAPTLVIQPGERPVYGGESLARVAHAPAGRSQRPPRCQVAVSFTSTASFWYRALNCIRQPDRRWRQAAANRGSPGASREAWAAAASRRRRSQRRCRDSWGPVAESPSRRNAVSALRHVRRDRGGQGDAAARVRWSRRATRRDHELDLRW